MRLLDHFRQQLRLFVGLLRERMVGPKHGAGHRVRALDVLQRILELVRLHAELRQIVAHVGDGSVQGEKTTSDSVNNNGVSDCVLRTIRHIRFTAPEAGTCTISWPFVFSNSN